MGKLLFFCYSALVVRFFRTIGQPHKMTHDACPILPHYRTSPGDDACRLPDSSALSDIILYSFECGITKKAASE